MSQRRGAATLNELASIFKLLADKTRLEIILRLSHGEQNVTQLCSQLELPQPTVSHHLGLLRDGKVLLNRRAGKTVFYKLNPDSVLIRNGEVRIEIDQVMRAKQIDETQIDQ